MTRIAIFQMPTYMIENSKEVYHGCYHEDTEAMMWWS